jgi:RNA polymerase sigma-70 factor (ECF subfamily)
MTEPNGTKITDDELMLAIASGDETAMGQLILRWQGPLHRFLARMTGNTEDAEDLTQETFVTYWRKQAQFRGEGSLTGYLRRIAYRAFLNSRSRIAARRPPVSLPATLVSSESTGELVDGRDTRTFCRKKVDEALASLPDVAREAFLMFRFEGLSVAEVADTVGAPVRTVESRLRRAMQHLRERLHKYRDQLVF